MEETAERVQILVEDFRMAERAVERVRIALALAATLSEAAERGAASALRQTVDEGV